MEHILTIDSTRRVLIYKIPASVVLDFVMAQFDGDVHRLIINDLPADAYIGAARFDQAGNLDLRIESQAFSDVPIDDYPPIVPAEIIFEDIDIFEIDEDVPYRTIDCETDEEI